VDPANLFAILPIIASTIAACVVLIADIVAPGRTRLSIGLALGGLAIVAAVVLWVAGAGEAQAFGGAYTVDAVTTFLDLVFIITVALTIVFAPDYLAPRDLPMPEFATVLLFALTGAMLISASTDLLLLFLALELMVLPGYMLAGFAKRDALATEGAIKYFLLGSFSSAIFLFGLAFTWGLTGTTRVAGVAEALATFAAGGGISLGLAMGLALLTTGVAFKIAAVPFHYWTPDAYQGSPTPVTGYLSVGPKIGAFALIIRLFAEAFAPLASDWLPVFVGLAILTMTLGNLVALTQDNVKRMLAYSSIAHTGYMLVGLAAYASGELAGMEGLLLYGLVYAFMNLGAFAVVSALQRRRGVTAQLSTFAGLGRREPWLGVLMTLFLLSLTGIPPTAGFFAKAYVILAAVESADPWVNLLAVIAVLNAAGAAFYYLRVVRQMYMEEPATEEPPTGHGRLLWAGLVVSSVFTALFFIFTGPVFDSIQRATQALATI
jgi:NADH-quinone oxidoreductase subunit N